MNLFELLFVLFHLWLFVTVAAVVGLDDGWLWALPAGVLAVAVSLGAIYGLAAIEGLLRRALRRGRPPAPPPEE